MWWLVAGVAAGTVVGFLLGNHRTGVLSAFFMGVSATMLLLVVTDKVKFAPRRDRHGKEQG